MGGPMTTASGQVARNGVLAMLGVLLVSSTMGQPQSDPLRLSKRSSMDLRLSKRALIDNLVELDNLPESSLLEYESPLFENLDKREVMENLEKRESMLRLSKRDLLRLSKRDLLRLSKRDFLRLTKKSEDSSNRDLRLSKRPEWSEGEWQPPLLDKKDKTITEVPMIIRLSKRDLSRLLNEGSLGRDAAELRLANRLSKRTFETVN